MSKDQPQPVQEKAIHPSHETYTKKPYHAVGDRVKFSSWEGSIEEVKNEGTADNPVFTYKIKFDDAEINEGERGFVKSTDLRKI